MPGTDERVLAKARCWLTELNFQKRLPPNSPITPGELALAPGQELVLRLTAREAGAPEDSWIVIRLLVGAAGDELVQRREPAPEAEPAAGGSELDSLLAYIPQEVLRPRLADTVERVLQAGRAAHREANSRERWPLLGAGHRVTPKDEEDALEELSLRLDAGAPVGANHSPEAVARDLAGLLARTPVGGAAAAAARAAVVQWWRARLRERARPSPTAAELRREAADADARARALRRLLDGADRGLDETDGEFDATLADQPLSAVLMAVAVATLKQEAEPFVRKVKWCGFGATASLCMFYVAVHM
jgi:hypothetical protein